MTNENEISREDIEFLFHLSDNFIVRTDEDFKILEVNESWKKSFDEIRDETVDFSNFCTPKEKENFIKILTQVWDSNNLQTFKGRFLNKSKEIMHISWKIGRKNNFLFAIGTDQTEATKQKRYFSEIQEAAKIGYWRFDIATQIPIWSEKTYDIHGLERGSPIELAKALEFYKPKSKALIVDKLNNAIEKGTSYDVELEFINAQGKELWVRAIGKPIMKDGKTVELYGVFQDITTQKLAEIQLQFVHETAGDGFWDWEMGKDQEYMSPRFWEILGHSHEGKKNHPSEWQELMYEDDLAQLLENLEKYFANKEQQPFWQEVRYYHKDGSTVWVVFRGKVIEWDETGKPQRMIGTHTDITALKNAQARLTETAKLTALGEMAGGIAHEINNPLAIIATHTVLMKMLVENSGGSNKEKLIESVVTVEKTVRRISKIVEGMKQLLRKKSHREFKSHDIKDVVEKSLALCREKIKSRCIHLDLLLKSDLKIFCDLTQISQVLINLINNSIDAIEEAPSPWIKIETYVENENIVLTITDSGTGISPKHRENLFQPFYTTKEATKGTGLGLSISKEIIEKHQGQLKLDIDSPNTRFIIKLPKNPKIGDLNDKHPDR